MNNWYGWQEHHSTIKLSNDWSLLQLLYVEVIVHNKCYNFNTPFTYSCEGNAYNIYSGVNTCRSCREVMPRELIKKAMFILNRL